MSNPLLLPLMLLNGHYIQAVSSITAQQISTTLLWLSVMTQMFGSSKIHGENHGESLATFV
jgi:hypothetical protein